MSKPNRINFERQFRSDALTQSIKNLFPLLKSARDCDTVEGASNFTFFARRWRSEGVPLEVRQASSHGIAGDSESGIAREVAVLVGQSVAGCAGSRAHAPVGRFRERRACQSFDI